MIRVAELKLPLGHEPEALPAALCARLGIAAEDLVSWSVARRANDARRKSAILMVYSLDAAVKDEAALLARHAGDPHIQPTPQTAYRIASVKTIFNSPTGYLLKVYVSWSP